MHLLNLYSLSSGSKIDKPQIALKYFPLTIDKYITFHSTSKDSKNYDVWGEVISLLLPILQKEGISIVQVGGKDDRYIPGCINLLGQCSINQSCYVLSKSLLHLGCDSFPVHFCSSLNKKIVAIYANNYISNVGPFWSKPEEVILLEPERKNGEKPSFTVTGDKSINNIRPELIASSVCKLLNLEFKYDYKTLFIGPNYQNKIVESAGDSVINISNLGINNIIVRADYNFSLENLLGQLQICKCVVVTNKEIPIEPLIQLKPNIIEILYEVTENHNPEFIKALFQAKIPFRLYTKLPEDKLNPIKLEYLSIPHIIFRKDNSMPAELKGKDLKNIVYKSSKFSLGRGKIYQSFFDYKNNRPVPDFNSIPLPIIDINLEGELFIDKDNLCFLEKNNLTNEIV